MVSLTNESIGGKKATDEQMGQWVEQFHRDGFLLIKNVLSPGLCKKLRDDLDTFVPTQAKPGTIELKERVFEVSSANLSLFDLEPIATFAEAVIGEPAHVIHNNSFRSLTGGGGIVGWHQDDRPHLLIGDGPAPTNLRLPVLLFTANYYLTDVLTPENGGTETIPGSHLFGKPCPPTLVDTEYQGKVQHNCAPAGSVVLFNCQVWHRGGPNTSDVVRYITQVSYARRIIGHKYFPFMNYQMPEHIYRDASPRLRRLLGFLPSGAYG